METLQSIMTRRSIRVFKNKPIPEDLMRKLLEAAMNAPSAADARPWHFVVVEDQEKLNALARDVDEDNEMLKQAGAAILICGDESLEEISGFWPQDCSCAGQNIQLAAHDLGLGAIWLAIYSIPSRTNPCRKILGIPDNLTPFALLPLGYPDEKLPPEYRYDEKRVHWDHW